MMDLNDKQLNDYKFVTNDHRSVIIFSKFRVPFDKPKKNIQNVNSLKTGIQMAVKNLSFGNNDILYARYGTTERGTFFDVENVLFYNIGVRNFNKCAQKGVVFSTVYEREIDALRDKYNISKEYTHYYEYCLIPNVQKPNYSSLLAKWEDVALKCKGLKPDIVWKEIKAQKEKIWIGNQKINTNNGEKFSIVLRVQKKEGVNFRVMSAMKPLLDGLICVFHSSIFEEKELDDFSKKLSCEKEVLTDCSMDVLGDRKGEFLQRYGNNMKWNPADDLCDYVSILIEEGEEWRLSGEIYSVVGLLE